jgi:hypothetical protein
MTRYIVDCGWQMYGHVEVEADSKDEAISKVELHTPLADVTAEYVQESFEVDHDTTREVEDAK